TLYTFAWTATGGSPASGTGATLSTTYNVKGSYTVSVTITDANAKTATASATIAISPLTLSVTIAGPTTGGLNAPLTFTAAGSGGTTPYTFAWTATGGTPSSGTGASFSTTYSTKGSQLISVTATDAAGATATNSATVAISPLALTTDFTFPSSITPGTAATFTATTSGGTTPYTYAWTFGDGATGTGNPASHTYSTTGPFTVTLTVTDANA